jgi:CBS domain-containing protein
MARRVRRNTDSGVFEDPLKDYSPTRYSDELEESLCEDEVAAMAVSLVETITPDTTVEQAVRRMAEKDIGCLLVTDGDRRLLGIFSERDVLTKVAARYDQVKAQPVGDLMTAKPVVCYQTDSPAKALNLMAVGSFRHIPVVDVDGRVTGILGPRRVTTYLQKYLPIT